jgi:RimJ/RimL family protein N-acetyltransferase
MSHLELVVHEIYLIGERVTLRPMIEADWPDLLRWNSDPEVLYFSEGDDVAAYTLEEVQGIYREISQSAFCFIIEYQGHSIGECWLQRMNLTRILVDYPGFDLWRIDLLIGEKTLWGLGLGTEVIHLLTEFAFQGEGADYVFGLDIADDNPRSRRAFEKNGYQLLARIP